MSQSFDSPSQALTDISGDYVLDVNHTRLGFSARHAMVTTVRGQFPDFEGEAHVDTSIPSNSHVALRIVASSIDTGKEDRNAHLRSPDFFDVETFPEITFSSTDVRRDGDDWIVAGDLAIRDVSRRVEIPFTLNGSAQDIYGNMRVGFEGETTINRKDWGLTWNSALETGGVMVSDKIKLQFDVSAIQK